MSFLLSPVSRCDLLPLNKKTTQPPHLTESLLPFIPSVDFLLGKLSLGIRIEKFISDNYAGNILAGDISWKALRTSLYLSVCLWLCQSDGQPRKGCTRSHLCKKPRIFGHSVLWAISIHRYEGEISHQWKEGKLKEPMFVLCTTVQCSNHLVG